MTYIFIDTNIFLHFQDFQKINWLTEIAVEKCTIVVAPIVLDELDEKKIGTSRIGNKARQVLNQIESLIDNPQITDNVAFEVILDKPLQNIYEENGLNFLEQDHRLIASIIDFKKKRSVENVVLCTNDIGPRLRAKQFSIGTLKLSDKYLLPTQESEEEKKLRRLEQENKKLKNRIPKLSLRFGDLNEFQKFDTKDISTKNYNDFKRNRIIEIKAKYPYLEHIDPFKNPLASLTMGLSLTADQINSYNKKLDEYYYEYEKVLDQIFEQEIKKSLTFEIKLKLINEGSSPAEDVDLHLHFPDGFELLESNHIEDEIELPEPPYKPKHKLDFGQFQMSGLGTYMPNINIGNNLNFNRPSIKKTNSYDVDFSRKQLKHGYSEDLEELSIIFDSYADIQNFKFDYEISAGNLPEMIKGKLNVIFNKE